MTRMMSQISTPTRIWRNREWIGMTWSEKQLQMIAKRRGMAKRSKTRGLKGNHVALSAKNPVRISHSLNFPAFFDSKSFIKQRNVRTKVRINTFSFACQAHNTCTIIDPKVVTRQAQITLSSQVINALIYEKK